MHHHDRSCVFVGIFLKLLRSPTVFYPDWLANPFLVLKKMNKWRMCIDYTSLNKGYPKDQFALP